MAPFAGPVAAAAPPFPFPAGALLFAGTAFFYGLFFTASLTLDPFPAAAGALAVATLPALVALAGFLIVLDVFATSVDFAVPPPAPFFGASFLAGAGGTTAVFLAGASLFLVVAGG